MRAEVRVSGIVQGIGFRPFIYRIATKYGLVGYVRNRGDGLVEIVIEGRKNRIEGFLKELRHKPPPLARIYKITTKYSEETGEFKNFRIIKSSGRLEFSGSIIPPDIAICDECLRELRDPKNRRYNYFFITCTNCGPRYTIIERLPYDRPNTTMREFPMCQKCSIEYRDPANRRFHAQTIACKDCGPRVYLTTNDGEIIECNDPIREAGRLIEEGYIVAIKGNGGFHVATATTISEPIARLRRVKHRAQKPFAIMARDLEAVKTFADVSKWEAELLKSYIRPIVLLKKSEDYYLSELISPRLHTIGVMLPYTGLHVMLFDWVKEPAFVMTSANPPNEPIVIDNDEAYRRLGRDVDYILLHNRRIAQRCDDSVVRLHGKDPVIIRRSRGYAPEPIRLKIPSKKCSLGVGAELMVTACLLLDNKAFASQHIGDVENIETLNFLREAINHLVRLTNSRVEVIAHDLHPRCNTTRLAKELSEKFNCPAIPIQHHHAHLACIMAEYGLDEIVGIVCDGFGYGLDGQAWGGEILYCNLTEFKRLGYLQPQPMVGGDLATIYPLRMAAALLSKSIDVEEWLISRSNLLPHGEIEAHLIAKQIKDGKVPIWTTSCGRVLDAISAILGICHERTYEGEPAMKLESAAIGGRNILKLEPKIIGDNILDTSFLATRILEAQKNHKIADLAYSAQTYIANGLAKIAIQKAEELNIRTIAFTGGVAYNQHITETIREAVERNGMKLITQRLIPPGDGGISIGQSIIAAKLIK